MNTRWPKEKTETLLSVTGRCLKPNGGVDWKMAGAVPEFSVFKDYSIEALSKRLSFLKRKETPEYKQREGARRHKNKWSLEEIKKTVLEMDKNLNKSSDTYKIAVILFSTMMHGLEIVQGDFTGYPDDFKKRFSTGYSKIV